MAHRETVLLVDDVADSLNLFTRILHRFLPDVEIHAASSGAEALDRLRATPFDVVVLDVRMPGMDGHEVCRQIKANPKTSHIPVLMVSGVMTGAQDRMAGIDLGADGYLCKPFEPDEFSAHVRVLLRIKAAEDRLRKQSADLTEELADRTEHLRISEERFRALFEHAPDAIMVQSADGVVLDVNEAACQLQGLPRTSLLGRKVWELVPASERARVQNAHQRWFDGSMNLFEGITRRLDGGEVPVEVSGRVIQFGAERAALLLIRDISRRVSTEAALRKSESRYRAMVEDLSDLICRRDRDGTIRFANPALGRFLGRDPDLLAGQTLEAFIPEGERARLATHLMTLSPSHPSERIDHLVRGADGRFHWIQWIDHGIFDEAGRLLEIQSAGRDITEQKLAQERQTLTSIWLRVVIDMADQLLTCADLESVCRRAVELARTHLGFERCSILLECDGTLHGTIGTHLDGTSIDLRAYATAPTAGWSRFCRDRDAQTRPWMEEQGPLTEWNGRESMPLNREGTTAWTPIQAADRYIGVFLNDNAVTGARLDPARQEVLAVFCSLLGNIIERKELDAERVRLVTAVDQSAECIMILTRARIVSYVNPAFSRIFGYPRESILGQTPALLKPDDQQGDFLLPIWEAVIRGDPWTGRLPFRGKDGSRIDADLTVSPVRDQAGQVVQVIAVIQDVSKAVRMEAELRQSQKMEMVGRLAGGIAHEFNNLLTGILGFSRFVAEELGPSHAVAPDVQEIIAAGERATRLTRRLLAFSRKNTPQLKPLEVNSVILSLNPLLRRTVGQHIELVLDLANDTRPVEADSDQLEQVLMNLAINARDAMPSGGKLTVRTTRINLTADSAALRTPLKPGRHVLLSVRDTGTGMSPEVRARIFEPFFTTKDRDKGSGLGLSTVYANVQQMNGHIEVYSEPGEGTEFRIYVPETEQALEPEAPEGHDVRPEGGRETILVVEDEATVRHLTVRCLESLGYKVHTALNGSEGIRRMEELGNEIQLVLSDVVMPVMGGPEMVEHLRRKRPSLPVVYVSGFTDDSTGSLLAGARAAPLVLKPFTLDDLAGAIRKALES